MPMFCIKSVKKLHRPKKLTRAPSMAPETNMMYGTISPTPRSQWSRPTVSPAGAACSQWIGCCSAHFWSHPPADHRCGEFVVMIMRMRMMITVVVIQKQSWLVFYREMFSASDHCFLFQSQFPWNMGRMKVGRKLCKVDQSRALLEVQMWFAILHRRRCCYPCPTKRNKIYRSN